MCRATMIEELVNHDSNRQIGCSSVVANGSHCSTDETDVDPEVAGGHDTS